MNRRYLIIDPRDYLISRQVALKAAVDLVCSGSMPVEDECGLCIQYAERISNWILKGCKMRGDFVVEEKEGDTSEG